MSRQVTVAVLTYRRPEQLAQLLPTLVDQADSVSPDEYRVRVVVVDNDPEGSAKSVVVASGAVDYVHEPDVGISAARNRALDVAAASGATLLVFLDDDERPRPNWLQQMLATRDRYRATAVAGPVVSQFPEPLPPWIEAGKFFVRRRLPTGTALTVAATNNLLLDLSRVRRLGVRFDDCFGQTGGEDTVFTRQLARRGEPMVWCDEAVVVDVVPPERMTRSWVLRRAYSSGNSLGRVELALVGPGWRRWVIRIRCLVLGGGRVLAGTARTAAGLAGGSMGLRARGLRTACRGAGILAAAFGIGYREYRRG